MGCFVCDDALSTILEGEEKGEDLPAPTAEEIAAAEEAAAALVRATEEATPRVSVVKAHAGKVAAARQIGEGGVVVTLGATDRYPAPRVESLPTVRVYPYY